MSHSRSNGKQHRIRHSHFMQSLLISLITHEQINTTIQRAKGLKISIEPMITCLAKNDSVANRRKAFALLGQKSMVQKLVDISTRYKDRPGGYLRVLRNGIRASDCSTIANISFV